MTDIYQGFVTYFQKKDYPKETIKININFIRKGLSFFAEIVYNRMDTLNL